MYDMFLPKQSRKVWMHCNADKAYLHQCYMYLGEQQISELDLGYDMVMKVCEDKSNYIYCGNLFISVYLSKDLLACKTYFSGTI